MSTQDANGALARPVAMGDEGSCEAASTNLVVLSIGERGHRSPAARKAGSYFEWTRAVRDANPGVLPAHVKVVLFTLGTYADANCANAFPSEELLGSKLGKSERRVRDALNVAEREGFISRRRRNRQSTYRYWLTTPTGHGRPVATGHQRPDIYPGDLPKSQPFGLAPRTPSYEADDRL